MQHGLCYHDVCMDSATTPPMTTANASTAPSDDMPSLAELEQELAKLRKAYAIIRTKATTTINSGAQRSDDRQAQKLLQKIQLVSV